MFMYLHRQLQKSNAVAATSTSSNSIVNASHPPGFLLGKVLKMCACFYFQSCDLDFFKLMLISCCSTEQCPKYY